MIFVETISGARVNLEHPDPETIHLEDLARHLSRLCRYAGGVEPFYSVAEHSVRTAALCAGRWQLPALLHDAAEAYIGDIPGPVRRLPGLWGFDAVEERLQFAIALRFGVYPALLMRSPVVQIADRRMLALEAVALKNASLDAWGIPADFAPTFADVHELRASAGWTPPEAEARFLSAFAVFSGIC